jgi:TolA-binding protein
LFPGNVTFLKASPPSKHGGFLGAVLAVLVLFTGLFASSGFAQEDEMKAMYAEGMAAFQKGDWPAAIEKLETLIKQLGGVDSAGLESTYYTLAAAYFNSNNYDKALDTFKTFQQKYPKSTQFIDASMAMAQCNLLLKKYAEAEKLFAGLETIPGRPDLRDQALFLEASAYRDDKQIDKAIERLELLIQPEIKTNVEANGGVMLVTLLGEKDPKRAVAVLLDLVSKSTLIENPIQLNSLAVKIGDEFYAKKLYSDAFTCYHAVKSRSEIITTQNQRIAGLNAQIQRNLAAIKTDPGNFMRYVGANTQVKTSIDDAQKFLKEFEKLPDYAPTLLVRIASCYYELGKKWEAVAVYDELLLRHPLTPEKDRESAAFATLAIMADVTTTPGEIQRLANEYLKNYPTAPKENRDTAGFMVAASSLQVEDPDYKMVAENLDKAVKEQKDSKYHEQMLFLLGSARFALGEFDHASEVFKKYLDQYPNGDNAEAANYHYAVGLLFGGKMDEAYKAVQEYLKKYPHGNFVADARYRVEVCKYAYAGMELSKDSTKEQRVAWETERVRRFEEVVKDCQAWEKDFPGHTQVGEVLALKADSLGALEKFDEAIDNYVRSWKAASSDELLNYSIFEAAKLMQKKSAWDRIAKMFQEFIEAKGPDHPTTPTAAFWIAKAMSRDNKLDEAKTYLGDMIQKKIADRRCDAVETLLTQLAQLCGKKKKKPAPPPDAPVEPTVIGLEKPAPDAAKTEAEKEKDKEADTAPVADFEKALGSAITDTTAVVQARVLFGKAELADVRKQPEEREKDLSAIAEKFKPEDLSAMVLAQVGDFLYNKGESEKAEATYQALMNEFPKSDFVEYAYAGLGNTAFAKKDYDKAFDLYTDAIEKVGATAKLKDVTMGRARTLYELGKLDDAKKAFEQIASVREWRGEITAESVFMVGQIFEKQGKTPEAIGRYQRVYVSYAKWIKWVAQAYIRSAECFEKIGDMKAVINTYKEMVGNKKLEKLPEYEVAKKRLGILQPTAGNP